ncbi:DUF6263 family protein [Corynebacterium sp. sy039]|uniref:DUF6263 family protein n=1 Tax=Corynebacterium sp. sy039 TaxID=2599641 RepID=UPI0011B36BCD|nr:DUF6263 family protein [Corynebacterium sp. sy039]QDZ42906.1 hypothetical protein FQV43_06815 [Corynebacterium sp. sy039]
MNIPQQHSKLRLIPDKHRIRTIVSIMGLLVLMSTATVACSTEEKTLVDSPVGAEVDPVKITMLSSGTSSTNAKVLRYLDLANGETDKQKLTLEISEGFAQSVVNNDAVDPQAPAGGEVTTLTSSLEAETITPENSDSKRSVSLSITDSSSDNLADNQDLDTTQGFRFGWFASDAGQISSVNLAAPSKATDAGRSIIEQYYMKLVPFTVVFPADPISVGGSWKVESRVANDSTMLQTTTYTVTDLVADTVHLDVSVEQRPVLGALSLPIDDQTRSLTVLSSTTTSQGKIVVDLHKPLPVSGDIGFTTRVVYGEESTQTRVVQDSTQAISFGSV